MVFRLFLLSVLTGICFSVQAAYKPQLTPYTNKMNQCLACTNTRYVPLTYSVMGGYVWIDGKKLWVERYGQGKPAVIFFNGGGETTRQWK